MKRIFLAAFLSLLISSPSAGHGIMDDLNNNAVSLEAYRGENYSLAFELFQQLAQNDSDVAQLMLGEMYEKGRGVEQDLVQAYFWYYLVAEEPFEEDIQVQSAGSSVVSVHDDLIEDAWHGRERIAEKMSVEQIFEAEKLAREWERKKHQ